MNIKNIERYEEEIELENEVREEIFEKALEEQEE